ncbi:UDP-glycosyltransferase 76E2 isoform X1 [Eucalyptus grandis]|uniref:UDP-glycosyltransferase 76E2 isoform X1 n=2 Tax=Eucalyptus grandis TaxID=71139 RepID=UPI00192E9368|nr:UDP-glycosyltransferase 76E2 isoform X1 [Eucalyptus grandis]
MDENRKRDWNRHLVLVPCPLQGHLNPMLSLASVFHSKGFGVTLVLVQTSSHPAATSWASDDFFYESLGGSDGSISNAPDVDLMRFLNEVNLKCKSSFRDCLMGLRMGRLRDRKLCVVYDAIMYFSAEVSDELEIPRVVLRTSIVANFLGLSMLNQKAYLPAQEDGAVKAIQELIPSMRARDMPVFDRSCPEATERVLAQIHESTSTASAIVWNTLQTLEQALLHRLQSSLSPPIFPIGPLHKYRTRDPRRRHHRSLFAAETGARREEDRIKCVSFLDSHPPGSVVYVSTGSLVRLSRSELAEMARGLADCGQPFLWAVELSSAHDGDIAQLIPRGEELLCAAADCHPNAPSMRGLVVAWAPQEEVLAHGSVGCFWTHNGWNSTLESMTEGVPMLCWPRVGDQKIIAGFVTRVWRVGLELECDGNGGLERGRISRSIKRLMAGEEGREIRKRALEMEETVELALSDGGCSSQSLSKLVDFIQLL